LHPISTTTIIITTTMIMMMMMMMTMFKMAGELNKTRDKMFRGLIMTREIN
jgi:hypothetical protein